ncbi:MAG: type II secretion system F family protein [Planctomycetaceae bacterium]|nr:type II secretion system F family protein [Planctomycetaceae bacterium]
MPTFQYEAMDNTGLEIKDTVDAATEQEAQRMIKEKGFYITKINEQGRTREKKKAAPKKKSAKSQKTFVIGGVRPKQLTTFTRQLSTLQDAGLPILRSLRILEGQSRPGPLKNALIDVIEEIESGSTLSEAMAKQPKAFDNLYVNMVKAGEAGGALEIILQRLADFKEKAQSLKRKVIGAMIYPAVVITVAVVIVTGIMYFIIPEFKSLFEEFELKLPWLTLFLISCSDWVVNNWFLIPMIPIGFWLFVKIVKKNKTGAYISDFLSLKFPLLGMILRKATIARVMRTLGTLIASGVPILEALIIARDTSGNAVFRRAFDNIYAAIREGESMAVPLREARITDDMVVNMVDVGEETGALDTMLYKVADVYEEEVEVAVESLISVLEPIMVVVLGVIVGTIVIALFLPMIELINSLS